MTEEKNEQVVVSVRHGDCVHRDIVGNQAIVIALTPDGVTLGGYLSPRGYVVFMSHLAETLQGLAQTVQDNWERHRAQEGESLPIIPSSKTLN